MRRVPFLVLFVVCLIVACSEQPFEQSECVRTCSHWADFCDADFEGDDTDDGLDEGCEESFCADDRDEDWDDCSGCFRCLRYASEGISEVKNDTQYCDGDDIGWRPLFPADPCFEECDACSG